MGRDLDMPDLSKVPADKPDKPDAAVDAIKQKEEAPEISPIEQLATGKFSLENMLVKIHSTTSNDLCRHSP